MSYPFDSRLGEQLYKLLPEIYRTRDKKESGDADTVDHSLARYLDAHGVLLDLIHATIEQQLRDALPGSSQEWLLPYFSKLVATNIISPDAEGKHAEVSNAISWRQRKGTLKCTEEIAEAVGRMEVELQEGWKRVAMTPRIGMPLIPLSAVDASLDLDMGLPQQAIRHPALPAAMVDLRYPSRAVETTSSNPVAKSSAFGGIRQTWRQANQHGVPCFPGSYEDVSRRTVDIRTPDEGNGRYHHKRVLLFAPPATGFFTLEPESMTWAERLDSIHEHLIEETVESGVTVIRNRTERIIEITDDVALEAKSYRIEGIIFLGELKVPSGGTLELSGVEAVKVSVATFSTDEPVLTACDCLFGELSSAGLIQLDSCSVLYESYMPSVRALDSLFMAIVGADISGSFEYCRIPADAPLSADQNRMAIKSHHSNPGSLYEYDPVTDVPAFIGGQTALAASAVLSPNAPESIYAGASDGGEIGYFHRGRQNGAVHITGDLVFSLPENGGYALEDLIFDDDVSVNDGPLVLRRSAAPKLSVNTPLNDSGEVAPSLTATDCLFQSIDVEGLARLEYCTIMDEAKCKHLQASDCIFAGEISGIKKQKTEKNTPTFVNCIRYSSIPPSLKQNVSSALMLSDGKKLTLRTNTMSQPVFDEFRYCGNDEIRNAHYGERSYGILGPHTPRAIRFGAEDGGEMGAYHHKHYALKTEAMLVKIREFLPVGIEPVLIEDERLLHVPPEETNS